MPNTMTIREAAAQARKWPHGCGFHTDAMTVLFAGYRRYNDQDKWNGVFITLDALWDWVEGYLAMEAASHEPTPLG